MGMLHPYDAANGLGENRRPPLACQLILVGALSPRPRRGNSSPRGSQQKHQRPTGHPLANKPLTPVFSMPAFSPAVDCHPAQIRIDSPADTGKQPGSLFHTVLIPNHFGGQTLVQNYPYPNSAIVLGNSKAVHAPLNSIPASRQNVSKRDPLHQPAAYFWPS